VEIGPEEVVERLGVRPDRRRFRQHPRRGRNRRQERRRPAQAIRNCQWNLRQP
jgi:hypothetical protein